VIQIVKPEPGKSQNVSLCDHIQTSQLGKFSQYYDYATWAA